MPTPLPQSSSQIREHRTAETQNRSRGAKAPHQNAKGGKTRATASFIKNPGEWHWISLDTAHGEVCRHHRGCVERIEVHSIDADASGTPSVTGMKRISAP